MKKTRVTRLPSIPELSIPTPHNGDSRELNDPMPAVPVLGLPSSTRRSLVAPRVG